MSSLIRGLMVVGLGVALLAVNTSGLTVATAASPGSLCVSAVGFSQVLNKVFRYDAATGAFTGLCASGGDLSFPVGVTFGPDGNLYVASLFNGSIRRYNGTTGAFIDAFVPPGGGGLSGPNDLVFGPDGNLYVASNGNAVRRYNA